MKKTIASGAMLVSSSGMMGNTLGKTVNAKNTFFGKI